MGDRPFVAEYAKSSRSSCKACREVIEKESLRLGIMIQSTRFDGRIPLWHHFSCFWSRAAVKTESDIKGFDELRWADQEKVRQTITQQKRSNPLAAKEGNSVKSKTTLPDISAVSVCWGVRAAKCALCASACAKGDLRIVLKLGKQNKNHHLQCFADCYFSLVNESNVESISGFEHLSDEARSDFKKYFISNKRKTNSDSESSPQEVKKVKRTSCRTEEWKLLKIQSEEMWKVRDSLKNNLTKGDLVRILEMNNQEVPSGMSKLLDRLVDCIMFGVLKPCQQCSGGQLVYSSTFNAYVCIGSVSGWTRCTFTTRDPGRSPLVIPEGEQFSFLTATHSLFTFKRKRIFPTDRLPSSNTLKGLTVYVEEGNSAVEAALEAMGARVSQALDDSIMLAVLNVLTLREDYRLTCILAKLRILTVSTDFVDALKTMHLSAAISATSIGDWEVDNIETKREKLASKPKGQRKRDYSEDRFYESVPKKTTLLLKRGGAVEPDSGLTEVAHIHQDQDGTAYNAVLQAVDVQNGQNSYYKIQLLKHDAKEKYWLFRSWGRVGTTIGDKILEKHSDELSAICSFSKIYASKTGNKWEDRDSFVKYPSKFVPVEINYETDALPKPATRSDLPSDLPKETQQLLMDIYNVAKMRNTMAEFNLDQEKMPLGRLSEKQIECAFRTLSELEKVLNGTDDPATRASKIADCTTRFYALVPHSFGIRKPPLLDSITALKKKIEMLEDLREIDFVFHLLSSNLHDQDPLEVYYERLNADIKPMDTTNSDFEMIRRYVANTHAPSHAKYKLTVEQVFEIDRRNEQMRYKPFKKLPNRMLLWHGSRQTNYAGILCQGLRIAPPEAPASGYMFGKGIYFADMVTKSANYCYPTRDDPYGYLLLCEVALGNILELKKAKCIEKLPSGKHSVKGIGASMPNPVEQETTNEGVVIPLGKPVPSKVKDTTLMYNEYIVYDVAQLNIKYLVKLKFKFR
uniref:Poly [ADP-ribose] polymerase n=1 Tax=Trichuris muris TaxID=70415 RepID=A0A5S6QUU3_TRIMR